MTFSDACWNRKFGRGSVFCAIVFLCFVFLCPESGAKERWVRSKDGLKALMQLAKDRGKMEKEYEKETEAYESVTRALDEGRIEKGQLSSEIDKKFGEPVVIVPDASGDRTRWVYKPADGSFIDPVPKACLYFDNEGRLVSWEAVEAPEEEAKGDTRSE